MTSPWHVEIYGDMEEYLYVPYKLKVFEIFDIINTRLKPSREIEKWQRKR